MRTHAVVDVGVERAVETDGVGVGEVLRFAVCLNLVESDGLVSWTWYVWVVGAREGWLGRKGRVRSYRRPYRPA